MGDFEQEDDTGQAAPIRANEALEQRTQELSQSLWLLAAALDAAFGGILIVGLDGRVQRFNTQFAAMWHLPASVLEGARFEEVIDLMSALLPDPAASVRRLEAIAASPETVAFDTVGLKDGRIFERHVTPMRVDGACVGTVLSFVDTTAAHRASETHWFQAQLLDHVGEAVIASDPTGRILYANHSASTKYGWTPDELRGRHIRDLIAEPLLALTLIH